MEIKKVQSLSTP